MEQQRTEFFTLAAFFNAHVLFILLNLCRLKMGRAAVLSNHLVPISERKQRFTLVYFNSQTYSCAGPMFIIKY